MSLNRAFKILWLDVQSKRIPLIILTILLLGSVISTMKNSHETAFQFIGNVYSEFPLGKFVIPLFLITLYLLLKNFFIKERIFRHETRQELFKELSTRLLIVTVIYILVYDVLVLIGLGLTYNLTFGILGLLIKLTIITFIVLFFLALVYALLAILTGGYIFSLLLIISLPYVDRTADVYFNKEWFIGKAFWNGEVVLFWQDILMKSLFFVGLILLVIVILESVLKNKNFY